MKSKCHDAQDVFDARASRGEVGALERRPYCDAKGRFVAFDCVPTQTCFCQSEEGERLFGEVLYTGPLQNMPCGCSRFNEQIRKLISTKVPFPVPGPRCTADGNFNPVQCIDRICYCVNRINGEISGGETINLDTEPISKLPCYDPNFDLFPEIFWAEPPYNYTTPCYNSVQDKAKIIEQGERDGFIMDYFNTFDDMDCLPDGTTGRIGRTRNGSKICIDQRQNRIGDYEAHMNTPEYENMDCKCALTTELMTALSEKPVCCANGNFRTIQCYRGFCRCVDSDGRQIGREEREVNRLQCFTSNWQQC
ncbi:uncharacterized protein LOC126971410 isoform X2 [Leptidea sinapis]|nr:uncharacterized protein LOC126971410 isoform X2 [Leptidea sinapis]XP_050673683.1 uncharacterized protein LOC126971410 isoform X2 [Leptidea sinapis]XP_050673684.1 uncharacterized protein LOC126971410 isoform X2 [Leptidea sinapis]